MALRIVSKTKILAMRNQLENKTETRVIEKLYEIESKRATCNNEEMTGTSQNTLKEIETSLSKLRSMVAGEIEDKN